MRRRPWLQTATSQVLQAADERFTPTAHSRHAEAQQAAMRGDHATASRLYLSAAQLALTHSGAAELIAKAIDEAQRLVKRDD